MSQRCKICEAESPFFAKSLVLDKYEVDYFQCDRCGFIQTETPYWLDEAYQRPISKSDIGLPARNIIHAKLVLRVISTLFDTTANFLDYGGGYGLFVRLVRYFGLNFYTYDKYCTNIFSPEFEITNRDDLNGFELVTAFEVVEHLTEPVEEIGELLSISNSILFSTELLPRHNPRPGEWHYYAPHEGQHVSIYSETSLRVLADRLGLNLYTDGQSVHLLTGRTFEDSIAESLEFYRYNTADVEEQLKLIFFEGYASEKQESPSHDIQPVASADGLSPATQGGSAIVIDGVFFQLYDTGIARVWKSLLERWGQTEFAQTILVLNRANTAPIVPGIRYRVIPPYDYNCAEDDRQLLQAICDEEGASLFVSTYYTTPTSTPSVFMAYDMIPEVMGWDLGHPMWREKHRAIQHASAYVSISQNTANDLAKTFTDIDVNSVTVAHCGVSPMFTPASGDRVAQFKTKYGITKPYFILVGAGGGPHSYKNAILFFQAFAEMPSKYGFEVICTGSDSIHETFRAYAVGTQLHALKLTDEELSIAYSGAIALVYPSKYEGFGLPIIEAMACGCPVITCAKASIPEVSGDAAYYIEENDVRGMVDALCDVQKTAVRQSLIAAGLIRAKEFTWQKMAKTVENALLRASLLEMNLRTINYLVFPDWTQSEDSLGEDLLTILRILGQHPAKEQMTVLFESSGVEAEEVGLLLSGIAMNLMLEEELDIESGPEIALTGDLSQGQWNTVVGLVNGRIAFEAENTLRIKEVGGDRLKTYALEEVT